MKVSACSDWFVNRCVCLDVVEKETVNDEVVYKMYTLAATTDNFR